MKKAIIILSFLTALISCKIQYSMVDGSIDASTFSVDIFEEQAPKAPAGYGANFSNFLKDFVISRTKLNLSLSSPDIEISGKIINYDTAPLSVQADESAALNRLTITVLVSVINNKDDAQSFERNFSQFSDYDAKQDLSEVETALIDDINNKLSQDIINQLTSNW